MAKSLPWMLLLVLLLAAGAAVYADFSQAADKTRDSVVTVTVPTEKRMGTGFIVNPDGVILTNKHVLDKATAATVKLANGDELPAQIVKADDKHDLLLLKIARQHLPAVVFSSSSKLKQGVEVAAVGAPFGLSDTLTKGVVSSTSRDIDGQKYLQIDAALNQGNSGGPIINEQGQVVGIATKAALKAENMGFAIPSDDVMSFLTEAQITFSTLDAPATAGAATPATPGTTATPPTPAPVPVPPPAPAAGIPPWMWLVAAVVLSFIVSLITSLAVAKSAVRRPGAQGAPMAYAPPPAYPVAPAGWAQPAPQVPSAQPAPPPRDDLNDIDIELR